MPKRVPQYLKEISTSLSGQQQGEFASEWGYAGSPYQHESHGRDWYYGTGDYLGWWDRKDRGVYYFGEHQPPKYFKNPDSYYWDAYYWYRESAGRINQAFVDEEKAKKLMNENSNLFSTERAKTALDPLPTYWAPKLDKPDDIRNINGIYAWLKNQYQPTEKFLNEYNAKANKFNEEWSAFRKAGAEERRIELENKKKANEDARYNTITTHLAELRNKIDRLDFDVKQSKADKNKEFSLFKSELTSKIPDPNLNVSRIEHDEDIAQLNETLNSIKQGMAKNAKGTDDSIAKLQKQVRLSFGENSRLNKSISTVKNDVELVAKNLRLNKEVAKKQQEDIQTQARRSEKLLEKQYDLQDDIANLRKNLQVLGGETKEFIDNTKRREMASKAKVVKKESVVTRTVKKAAFPDLTKRPWLRESVTGRFFQLANQW